MKQYELKTIYDSAKSFYGKAEVKETKSKMTLFSYGTKVASINKGVLRVFNTQSQTTRRHINEFIQQNGFTKMTKKELEQIKVK